MSLITIENLHLHTDSHEADRLLRRILERINHMPTVEEMKTAVVAAVAKERAEFLAAVKKAVEDAIAAVPSTISDADAATILAAIDGVVTTGDPGVPA